MNHPPNPKSRGQAAEALAEDEFIKRRFVVVAKNLKTPFAEVDLLVRHPQGAYFLVEVKTAPNPHFASHRLSLRQRQRLLRAFQYLSKYYQPLRTALVWVHPSGEVQIFEDFLTI